VPLRRPWRRSRPQRNTAMLFTGPIESVKRDDAVQGSGNGPGGFGAIPLCAARHARRVTYKWDGVRRRAAASCGAAFPTCANKIEISFVNCNLKAPAD
jgi:hypothetical protein